nr:MAG TPA: hypothetical protein [Bacteriophage sp.]
MLIKLYILYLKHMQRVFYFCRNLRDLVGRNRTHVLTPTPRAIHGIQ